MISASTLAGLETKKNPHSSSNILNSAFCEILLELICYNVHFSLIIYNIISCSAHDSTANTSASFDRNVGPQEMWLFAYVPKNYTLARQSAQLTAIYLCTRKNWGWSEIHSHLQTSNILMCFLREPHGRKFSHHSVRVTLIKCLKGHKSLGSLL